jgi:hypothetical protein
VLYITELVSTIINPCRDKAEMYLNYYLKNPLGTLLPVEHVGIKKPSIAGQISILVEASKIYFIKFH